MTRAAKPPRTVWVVVTPLGNPVKVERDFADAECLAFPGSTIHRYTMHVPKRKRGK